MHKSIFLVDDEPDILSLLSITLQQAKYHTREFQTGKKFLDALATQLPDLVILDLMLPDADGFELCKFLKSKESYAEIPIIVVTAKDTELDKVVGLEIGAEDYITKPFSSNELCARVKAVLRRFSRNTAKNTETLIVSYKNISLNTKTYEVSIDGSSLLLTHTEYKILEKLLEKPNWVLSRNDLLDHIWDDARIVSDRTVDVHIAHLREKLGNSAHLIKNVRGVGYKLN